MWAVDAMNLVYYKISSFSFSFYFPLSSEPSVEFHCMGIYREGLHDSLVCHFSNLIPRTSGSIGAAQLVAGCE